MKLLLVDFFRRWWGFYLFIFVLVCVTESLFLWLEADARISLVFVGLFTIPLWFDMQRRTGSVTMTLPISRKTLALFDFFLSVCVPVALIMLVNAISTQVFNRTIVFSWTDFAFTVFGALVVAGAICLLASFLPVKWAEFAMLTWVPAMLAGMAIQSLESFCHGPLIWLAFIILGLTVNTWAFIRSGKLIFVRMRYLPPQSTTTRKTISPVSPMTGGRFGMGFLIPESVIGGSILTLLYVALIFVSNWNSDQNLIFCVILPIAVAWRWVGLRLLRTLPLSTNQLALWLIMTPLCILIPLFIVCVADSVFVPGNFPPSFVASLLFLAAGAGSLGNACGVRYGAGGSLASCVLFPLFFVAAAGWVPATGLPAMVGWLLGSVLFVLGYFLMRRWLRTSESYQARKATMFS